MPAAARALKQPANSLRATDLNDLVDRREIDSQIEAGRAHDATHGPLLQPLFRGSPELPID